MSEPFNQAALYQRIIAKYSANAADFKVVFSA
jgi:hypothetical protein